MRVSGVLMRVGKNAAALVVARAGVLLLGLWLNGQIVRSVGVEGLGRYLLAMTVEGITLAVANLGLNLLATREFSHSSTDETAALLGTTLALKLAACVVAAAVLNGVLAPLLFQGPKRLLIAIASLALLPGALNGALEALIRGRQRMELSSAIDLAARLAGVLAGLGALRLGGDERYVLLCYAASQLLATLALAAVVARWRVRPRLAGWTLRALPLLREALPFAGADIVAILYRRVDLLLLSLWRGDGAAGVYGAAYRIWETLGLLPASLLDALFPELARRGSDVAARERLVQLYRRAVRALLAIAVALGAICFWLAPHLVSLLYGDLREAVDATRILRLLVLVLPLTCLYLLNGHVLYAVGEQRRVFRAMSLVTLGNAVVNVALIPSLGYWGAVIAALLAEAALAALLGLSARRRVLRGVPSNGEAL